MAKSKTKRSKSTDGDDLLDDDAPSVATAERPDRAKNKQSKNETAPKASTRRTKSGRKTGPAASKKAAAKPKAKASHNGREAVAHTTPKAGSEFTGTYKGKTYTMKVRVKGDGVVYVFKGKSYPTARAAANAARGRETNGWTFWGIVG